MYFQQKLNPPPPDPVQAKIFQYMPIVFTFMLASFPAGLVIYWSWNNLPDDCTTMDDHAAYRRQATPAAQPAKATS